MATQLPTCGTKRALARHRTRKEACQTCEDANAERQQQWREAVAYRAERRMDLLKARRQNSHAARGDLLVPTAPTGDDWRNAVYSTRGLNVEKERRQPRRSDQRRILAIQGNVCLYCSIPVGTIIGRELKRSTGYIWHTTVTLHRNWDHFVPFAFLVANPGANWVLACHVCNRAKGNRIFETVDDARRVILPIREERGYESVRHVLARLASG